MKKEQYNKSSCDIAAEWKFQASSLDNMEWSTCIKVKKYGYYCKSNKSQMCLEDEAYSISSLANSCARHQE